MGEFEPLSGAISDQSQELKSILVFVGPTVDVDDKFIWFTNAAGKYFLCYAEFSSLGNSSLLIPNMLDATTGIWKTKIPSKVLVFDWRCLKDRLATKEQLFKRGVISSNNDRACVLCSSANEMHEHLLLSCPYSKSIWDKVLVWLGISQGQV